MLAGIILTTSISSAKAANNQFSAQITESVIVATNGVWILGRQYSTRLLPIFHQVRKSFNKPITAVKQDDGNSEMEFFEDHILLRLKENAPEDVVAHELMHAVLAAEGYPRLFCISMLPESVRIHKVMVSSFDHLIINDRCIAYGYDARSGFLSHAASYASILNISLPSDADQKCIALSLILHQLIKFHFYFGDPKAEHAFLEKFPVLAPYWSQLSAKIRTFQTRPTPIKIWDVIEVHNSVLNQLAKDQHASVRIPELIGFSPVWMDSKNKGNVAGANLEDSYQKLDEGRILVRTYVKKSRIMVNACLVVADEATPLSEDLQLPIEDFGKKRGMEILFTQ